MGSKSTYHGLAGITRRQPKSKVSNRERKHKTAAAGTARKAALLATVAETPTVA